MGAMVVLRLFTLIFTSKTAEVMELSPKEMGDVRILPFGAALCVYRLGLLLAPLGGDRDLS